MHAFHDKVAALGRDRRRFATATVVGRQAPVSAHLGDRAIVHEDGRMEGFVGGACSREIVRKQALESMRTGRPRLVSIRPDAGGPSAPGAEHVIVPMTCASEGAVDVYVEPSPQPRRLLVVGTTPVADAVARMARTLDYEVVRVVDEGGLRDLETEAAALGVAVLPLDALDAAIREGGEAVAAVVASQGHYDEDALEAILRAGAAYVGLVASRKRGAMVKEYLGNRGVTGLDRIRNPAGLDLGARTAPEVAVSILAEIVQLHPSQALEEGPDAAGLSQQAAQPSLTAIDPVCRMEVDIATARHTADVEGTSYFFCCARCRTSFVENPAAFLPSRP
jgi:xanthine dehydrogenase accessory factor